MQQQLTRLAAAWCLAWPAWAQVAPPATPALATTPATTPATAPTAAPTAGTTAATTVPTTGPAPATPASTADCARLTDEAMAADLALASAQSSDQQDLQQRAAQLDKSMALWHQASQACTGRAQERALRNLRDNQRLRDSLQPQLSADPACTRSQHDASQLQELAQQALRERRWLDAAMLYRKAENFWDLAAERCTGKLQQQAQLKRSQTAEDAHNAEFCAPAFEKARDYTRQFRQTSASLGAIDKQTQSLAAETLWRSAESQCIGNAQTLARSNGQNLNKDRGTPWIATQPPVVASTQVATGTAGTVSSTSGPAAAGSAPAASQAATEPVPMTGATTGGNSAEPAKATLPWKDINLTISGTHYQGRFQQSGNTISGTGDVKWANGDHYQGELQATQPHGQGTFVWANGQRYQGQWVKGSPQGSGQLAFANGNQYQGEVVNGVPHGRGTLRYASGDSFEDLFEQGNPAGSGIYRWASGQSYEGPWRNGQPEGQGTLRFVNGNQYQGQLVAGQPEGEGRMTYAWGDRYQGGFAQGVPHGEGLYEWKNGDSYRGQWQQGKKHGQGTMTWANGDHWQGRFEQDQPTADGALTRAATAAEPEPQAAQAHPPAAPSPAKAAPQHHPTKAP